MGVVVVATRRDGEEGEQLELPEGYGLPRGVPAPAATRLATRPSRKTSLCETRLPRGSGGNVCPSYFDCSKSEGQGKTTLGFGRGARGI